MGEDDSGMTGGRMPRRYRVRTWARTVLPYVLSDRIAKGRRECAAHEWYVSTPGTWHCYRCVVGVTYDDPVGERR
jgi:hypothetical protein